MSGVFDDSAHRALIGYYYQILSTAGSVVELAENGFEHDPENDEHSCLTIVRPEMLGGTQR